MHGNLLRLRTDTIIFSARIGEIVAQPRANSNCPSTPADVEFVYLSRNGPQGLTTCGTCKPTRQELPRAPNRPPSRRLSGRTRLCRGRGSTRLGFCCLKDTAGATGTCWTSLDHVVGRYPRTKGR